MERCSKAKWWESMRRSQGLEKSEEGFGGEVKEDEDVEICGDVWVCVVVFWFLLHHRRGRETAEKGGGGGDVIGDDRRR